MRQAREASEASDKAEAYSAGQHHHTIDVYHHFPDGLPIDLSAISGALDVRVILPVPPPPPLLRATHAVLHITQQGDSMPGQITVDTTNETATLTFVDDRGNATAAPAGAVVTYSSDNPGVVTIANDPANPTQGDVTVVAIGTANLSASLADASGNPLFEADGVTPFPAPAAVAVSVGPGAAVGDTLVLSV